MTESVTWIVFGLGALALGLNLILMILAPLTKKYEYWPPPSTDSWQYKLFWGFGRIGFLALLVLLFFDIRDAMAAGLGLWQIIGIIVFVSGMAFTLTAGLLLGVKQTKGDAQSLRTSGLYAVSRNPQYVGAFFWLLGLTLLVTTMPIYILLALTAGIYALCPFMEEPWLEQHFGQDYLDYKNKVPRFLIF